MRLFPKIVQRIEQLAVAFQLGKTSADFPQIGSRIRRVADTHLCAILFKGNGTGDIKRVLSISPGLGSK